MLPLKVIPFTKLPEQLQRTTEITAQNKLLDLLQENLVGISSAENRHFCYSRNIFTSIQDSGVVRQLSAFLLLKSSHSQLQASYTQ